MSGVSSQVEFSRGALAWMIRNGIAANLLMIIFLVGGFIMSTQVKQEVFPEFTTDIIRVSVPYPGASPEEVEQGILLSVEDRVRGLEGVKRVTSTASEGVGTIVVELLTSADPGKSLQDIKNQVDRITSFPEDAERPVVSLVESRRRVVSLLIYGEQDRTRLRKLAERVRDDLIQQGDVTYVELGLAPNLEISVEIPGAKLREYDLTLEEVAAIIRRTALELPGGEVKTSGGQILLRTQERRNVGREFADIPITTSPTGAVVTVGDLAIIRDEFTESDEEAVFDGKPAIFVNVYRVGSETPQSVSAAVHDYIEKVTAELPENVGLKVWDDRSVIYKDRMSLLMRNAILGLTLVLILLGLFLEVRLAFWVTLGIPISVLGCFLILPFTGASINMISLFAFIVTLGIVVDDAVVTGENIYEKREQGMRPDLAAVNGVREIAMPVTFAVLTNIVAFLPLFFVPGISGKFFRQIPSVVVGVFIISLIESLFILPSHLSHRQADRRIWRALNRPRTFFQERLQRFIERVYKPGVNKIIRYRYETMAIAIAMLMVAFGIVRGGHIRFSFLPKIDADQITAQATLPFGVPMSEARRVNTLLTQAAARAIEKGGGSSIAAGTYSQIGGALINSVHGPKFAGAGGAHIVAAQVALVSSEEREIGASMFARLWREEIGEVVGLRSLVINYSTGASEGGAIEFNLSHRSRVTVETAAQELGEILKTYKGVIDIDDGVSNGKPQLNFQLSAEAHSLGVTVRDLARQVRSAYYGAEALRQQRGRNEIKVMVRLPRKERETMESIDNFIVRTPGGGELPLSVAANVTRGASYTEINRRNSRRIVTVSAEVDSEVTNANEVIGQLVQREVPMLMDKYPGLTYSFGGEREAQQESLSVLFLGFGISMLVIFALLAVPFGSYLQPIIVMLAIPFGIIGAVIGHLILGYGISIISLFGIIALSGVVVNDSLVLVVTANRLREDESITAEEAISRAGVRRFRPILLTSLTTFFGLAPMIFERSLQARFLIPMAISIGFGILFATVIILCIVPAVYIILEDIVHCRSEVGNYLRSRRARTGDT